MRSYKDKMFCPFWKNCTHGSTCHRAMTDEVVNGAKAAEMNIDKYSFPPVSCFDERPDNPVNPIEA